MAGKKGWANASAYCASKFGLTGFTEALADEGKEHGIRAIVLYPGAMATNWGAFSPEERRKSEPSEAPRTRILAPERVAELIAWLVASPPEFVLTEGGEVDPIRRRRLPRWPGDLSRWLLAGARRGVSRPRRRLFGPGGVRRDHLSRSLRRRRCLFGRRRLGRGSSPIGPQLLHSLVFTAGFSYCLFV